MPALRPTLPLKALLAKPQFQASHLGGFRIQPLAKFALIFCRGAGPSANPAKSFTGGLVSVTLFGQSMKPRPLLLAVLITAGCSNQPITTRPGAVLTNENLPEMVATTALDKQPKPIRIVNPEYPYSMRMSGSGGVVTVRFVVLADGHVDFVQAIASSDPRFAQEAEKAVRKWRFEPGEKNGRKVNCLLQVPLTFGIE